MFKEGSCTVDYSFHQENSIREKEVFRKYTNAVNENKEWYLRFYDSLAKGMKVDYNEKMGITKDEYHTLLIILNNNFLPQKGTVSIVHDNDAIRFKATGNLSQLNSIILNLNDSSVQFKNYTLRFIDTLKTISNLPDNDYLKSPYKFKSDDGTQKYRLVFGNLGKADKTFLEFKAIGITETISSPEYRLSVFFN
jgi:hypothetical protein